MQGTSCLRQTAPELVRAGDAAAHPAPLRYGVPERWSRLVTAGILPAGEQKAMRTQTEDDMRTALRQAGAIAAVGGERSTRRKLGLAHEIYDALILLQPEDRARRIRLIDAIFGSAAPDPHPRQGHL